MQHWFEAVIRQKGVIAIVVIVLVITGIAGGAHMPRDLFPSLNVPVVNLMVHMPGTAAQDLDLLVARPIQAAMRNLPDVMRVESISKQDLSITTIEFKWGMSVDEARMIVAANLNHIRRTLPPTARMRLASIGTTLQQTAGYVVYGADPFVLRRVAQYDLVSALRGVDGVAMVDCFGGEQQAFVVRVNQVVMAANKVDLSGIVDALHTQNTIREAGYGRMGAQESVVRGDGLFRTRRDMQFLPITTLEKKSIPLGVLARITPGKRPRRYEVSGNGHPAVAIIVHKQPGASAVAVSLAIKRVIKKELAHFPKGTHIQRFYDQAEVISAAGREVRYDLVFGFLLVALVLFFFLRRTRLTIVTAVQVPLALVSTLAFMAALGMGLNVITLTALILAVGMVVDDAIVVSENILRTAARGSVTPSIAAKGAAGIAGPDISGTLTTIAVFLPLAFIPGIAGLFARPFGISVSIALLASLVLSLSFVPAFMVQNLPSGHGRYLGDRVMNAVRGRVLRTLDWCMHHRLWTILFAAVFVIAAAGTIAWQRISILPRIDDNTVLLEYQLPAGVSMLESNRVGRFVEQQAMTAPGRETVYRRTGSPDTGNQIEGVSKGEILIHFRKGHTHSTGDVISYLKKRFAGLRGVTILYHQVMQEKIDESLWGIPSLFAVTVSGPDQKTLSHIAAQVQAILEKDPAVSGAFNPGAQQGVSIRVRPMHKSCIKYGVDPREVLLTLQAAGFGIPATFIRRESEVVPVIVKLGTGNANTMDAIRKLPVQGIYGPVPMFKVAKIEARAVPARISRLNSRRVITLSADVNGSISHLIRRLGPVFDAIPLPRGYSIEFTGSYKAKTRMQWYMLFVFLAALAMVFGIMYIQFHSIVQALIILAVVPVALAGCMLAALAGGTGIDLTGAMGMLTVAGVVVNNGIVLLAFANKEPGQNTLMALSTAVSVRMRPILLTMITTVLALVPTAIGFTGMSMFRPFALCVIGGLLAGLPAQLFLVPVLAMKRQASE